MAREKKDYGDDNSQEFIVEYNPEFNHDPSNEVTFTDQPKEKLIDYIYSMFSKLIWSHNMVEESLLIIEHIEKLKPSISEMQILKEFKKTISDFAYCAPGQTTNILSPAPYKSSTDVFIERCQRKMRETKPLSDNINAHLNVIKSLVNTSLITFAQQDALIELQKKLNEKLEENNSKESKKLSIYNEQTVKSYLNNTQRLFKRNMVDSVLAKSIKTHLKEAAKADISQDLLTIIEKITVKLDKIIKEQSPWAHTGASSCNYVGMTR